MVERNGRFQEENARLREEIKKLKGALKEISCDNVKNLAQLRRGKKVFESETERKLGFELPKFVILKNKKSEEENFVFRGSFGVVGEEDEKKKFLGRENENLNCEKKVVSVGCQGKIEGFGGDDRKIDLVKEGICGKGEDFEYCEEELEKDTQGKEVLNEVREIVDFGEERKEIIKNQEVVEYCEKVKERIRNKEIFEYCEEVKERTENGEVVECCEEMKERSVKDTFSSFYCEESSNNVNMDKTNEEVSSPKLESGFNPFGSQKFGSSQEMSDIRNLNNNLIIKQIEALRQENQKLRKKIENSSKDPYSLPSHRTQRSKSPKPKSRSITPALTSRTISKSPIRTKVKPNMNLTPRRQHCKTCDHLLSKGYSTVHCSRHGTLP